MRKISVFPILFLMAIAAILFYHPCFSQDSQTTPSGLEYLNANAQGFKEYKNVKDGSILILIPAGRFLMGSVSGQGSYEEHPQHTVNLSEYYIGKYEVTNAQFAKFVQETGYTAEGNWKQYYQQGKENHPVTNITWNDASAYCKWAGLRLPTEAEWEKAARGTDGVIYPWGNDWDKNKCNYWFGPQLPDTTNIDDGRGTTPIGSFPDGISPYGCLDMIGNVSEWCSDWYSKSYYSQFRSSVKDPQGPPLGYTRVLRGGSWKEIDEFYLRTAYRDFNNPNMGYPFYGFRCALGK